MKVTTWLQRFRERSEPARRGRYLAWTIVTGLAFGGAVAFAPFLSGAVPWMESPVPGGFFWQPLTLAAWLIAWWFRGRISTARGVGVLGATLFTTISGAWLTGTLAFVVVGCWAGAEGDWGAATGVIAYSWWLGADVAVRGWRYLPLAFPLIWLAVLVLRWAAGGATERSRRTLHEPVRAH